MNRLYPSYLTYMFFHYIFGIQFQYILYKKKVILNVLFSLDFKIVVHTRAKLHSNQLLTTYKEFRFMLKKTHYIYVFIN